MWISKDQIHKKMTTDRDFASYYGTTKTGSPEVLKSQADFLLSMGYFIRDCSMFTFDADKKTPNSYQFSAFLPGDPLEDPEYALLGTAPCVVPRKDASAFYAPIYVL